MTTEDEQTYAIYRQITTIASIGRKGRVEPLDNKAAAVVELTARVTLETVASILGGTTAGGVLAASAFAIARALARHGYRIVEK